MNKCFGVVRPAMIGPNVLENHNRDTVSFGSSQKSAFDKRSLSQRTYGDNQNIWRKFFVLCKSRNLVSYDFQIRDGFQDIFSFSKSGDLNIADFFKIRKTRE